MKSPTRANRARHRREREIAGLRRFGFLPRQRRRHARIGCGAHRVRRGHGAIFRVLVVIEKHAVPFFLPPLARRQFRRAPFDFARERQRRAAHLVEGPLPLDAHVHMNAARARRLRPSDETEIVERAAQHVRDRANVRKRHAANRIEIDAQLVRVIEIVGAHRMRMQLEARQVGHPHERCRVARHDFFGNPAGRKAQRDDVDPVGPRRRRALLKEEFAVDAIGIADEHVGPVAGRTQGALRDGEIVASEVELRVAGLRKEHLAGIRDRDVASGDRQDLAFRAVLHPSTLASL